METRKEMSDRLKTSNPDERLQIASQTGNPVKIIILVCVLLNFCGYKLNNMQPLQNKFQEAV